MNQMQQQATEFLNVEGVGPPSHLFVKTFVVLVILLGLVYIARAQNTATVQAGSKTTLAMTNDKIVDKSGSLKGTVRVHESNTTPRTYRLEYDAPKVTSDFTEIIKYTVGPDPAKATEHTITVTVTAMEAPTLTSAAIYEKSFKALFILFIIATLIESGLAVIFNWRPFIQLFDMRGVKTIVSVLFAWFFVSYFQLDIVTRLANLYLDENYLSFFPGIFLTALILAGGSSGVNKLLVGLGFRSIKTLEQVTPKPRPNEAWISVRLNRVLAKGPVLVFVGPPGGPLAIAGTITGSSRSGGLTGFFLRDYGRFPTTGGYSLIPRTLYEIELRGEDQNGKPLSGKWGPYSFEPGAIVDIESTL
jgi:hypothetical protein